MITVQLEEREYYIADLFIGGIADPLGQLGQWLANVFNEVAQWIIDTLKGIWDWILNAIHSIVKGISDVVTKIWDTVKGIAASVVNGVKSLWDSVINAIKSGVDYLKGIVDKIWSEMGKIVGAVVDSLKNVWDSIINAIKSGVDYLKGIVDKIWNELVKIVSAVVDSLKNAWDSLLKGIKSGVDWVASNLKGFIDGIIKTVNDGISFIIGSLEAIGKSIVSFLFDTIKAGIELIKNIGNWLNENVVKPVMQAFSWVMNEVGKAISGFINSIIDKFKGLGSSDPDVVFSNSIPIIAGLSVGALGIASLMSASQISIMGCHINLEPLARMVERIVSPELVTGVLIGAVMGACFKTPLTYWAYKTFRPTAPNSTTAIRMYWRGLIDLPTLYRYISYEGYSDKLIEMIIKTTQTLPSPKDSFIMWRKGIIDEQEYTKIMLAHGYEQKTVEGITKHYYYDEGLMEILRASDFVELDETWTRQKLRNLGMDEDSINRWIMVLKLRPIRTEQSSIANLMRDLVANGLMSIEEYEEYLHSYGFKPENIEIRKDIATLLYDKNLIKYKINTLIYQYRKGLIDENYMLDKLLTIGVDSAFAYAIVDLEKAKKGMPEFEEGGGI